MTTIYLSQDQAKSVKEAIKNIRMDGWHIEGVNLVIPEDGGCMLNLEGDISYEFLFKLGVKSGYILANQNITK